MSYPLVHAKKVSYGSTRSLTSILYIVLHYTGNSGDTAMNNAKYFANGNTRSAGAHWFVSQDGSVVQSIPMKYTAWSVGDSRNGHGPLFGKCTNKNSVSIEMCDQFNKDASEAQIKAVRELIAYIRSQCPNIKDVVRHHDVTTKHCLPVEETELLTKNGWKLLRDIRKGEDVCEYDQNTDSLRFSPTLDVVKQHSDYVLENHNFTATKGHRMYMKPNCANSRKFREVLWGDFLSKNTLYTVKSGAEIETAGLPLTDGEIKLLVWIQGDGHYMKDRGKTTGLEFHLIKERKIIRVCDVLEENGIEYTISKCENGSQHIRVYDKSIVDWAEKWLDDKQFTYEFVKMSQRQFYVFRNELLVVDGCKGEKSEMYTSIVPQNLDVVQAVCATHGIRTYQTNLGADYRCAVGFCTTNYTFSGKSETKTRKAIVSCVTVPSGYILVRQKFRTFIVGNCPGRYIDSGKWAKLKAAVTGGAIPVTPVTPDKPSTTPSGNTIFVDGIVGHATIRKWQSVMGTKVDGVISGRTYKYDKYLPAFMSSVFDPNNGSSSLIKAVQKVVGVDDDGVMGRDTIKAIQRYLGETDDGIFGKKTATALQKKLNTGKF